MNIINKGVCKASKFLAETLDDKIMWEVHIYPLCNRLSTACLLVKQLKSTITPDVLRIVFNPLCPMD